MSRSGCEPSPVPDHPRGIALDSASSPRSFCSLPLGRRRRDEVQRRFVFLHKLGHNYKGADVARKKIEGLLMNSRMVQGVFDDLNPETRSRWAYPDTGKWDAERNDAEFLAAMPVWRAHGLLAFTVIRCTPRVFRDQLRAIPVSLPTARLCCLPGAHGPRRPFSPTISAWSLC